MSIIYPERFSDTHNFEPPRRDQYSFLRANGANPADQVWVERSHRIQADGYNTMGFVKSEAITNEGKLDSSVAASVSDDIAPFTTYTIGANPKRGESPLTATDAITIHQVSLSLDDFPDLTPQQLLDKYPSYGLAKDKLYPQGQALLLRNVGSIVDIGGLAPSEEAAQSSRGTYEVIRENFQRDLKKENPDAPGKVWFFTIVGDTYKSMKKIWGKNSMTQIGDPCEIDSHLVENHISLTPAILNVDTFLRDIYTSALTEPNDTLRQAQLESFLFFSEGLPDKYLKDSSLGDLLIELRHDLREEFPDATSRYGTYRRKVKS